MATSFVSFDHLDRFHDQDLVRVGFENRSAWNGRLFRTLDDSLVRWEDLKKGVKNDRDFPLLEDEDGNVIVENKPEWGRMTILKIRKAR